MVGYVGGTTMDTLTLAIAKSYVDSTLKGAGAIQGKPGTDGKDGKSAYEIAVGNGFIGTEKEWIESLKGSNGTNGVSPTIIPDDNNTDKIYKLIIADTNGTIVTPNLIGKAQKIEIGSNGHWFIDGADTNVSAKGENGDTGSGFKVTKQY